MEKLSDQEEKRLLFREIDKLRNAGKHLSPEAQEIEKKLQTIHQYIDRWDLYYIHDYPSLATYYRLFDKFTFFTRQEKARAYQYMDEIEILLTHSFTPLYPNHPITTDMHFALETWRTIRVGEKYVDFTAPDFEGNPTILSGQIEGKVALIDLWASWCGPCRALSKSIIPIYEEYKEKGFTVVGVARETNGEYGIQAARQDNYPWLNLLEIKDIAGIWNKYGVGNAGGKTFLVDREGIILAIHPTAEELREILEKILP
ncbi:MAG: TlpA family protein disulfide reductase [Bacteroides sp.]|nr:TlpA family protein disulfide reductase [Bacteroides sp.]